MTLLSAVDEAAALENLFALGCTDGLPVVIPTPERVERMVLASGYDAELILGEMGPMMGIATIEQVATAAVMAGCLPDYMPLVLAAVKAVINPEFDLAEMQSTIHCTAPLVIINGPARLSCGPVASGFGALGPGFRPNATIGRALRLAMINIGGARPGESDMALLGHPGKFTYCLAEDEEHSPLPPLHTSLGFTEDDSVVTVIGCEAPHSVLYSVDGDCAEGPDIMLQTLAIGIANIATNNAVLRGGAAVIVLNPEHAGVLAGAGLTRADIQARLFELCSLPQAQLTEFSPDFAKRIKVDPVPAFARPEDIIVLVAGGTGLYSMVMPTWCAGPHANRAVSQLVELDQMCEIPGAG